jgi:hypothetical protein
MNRRRLKTDKGTTAKRKVRYDSRSLSEILRGTVRETGGCDDVQSACAALKPSVVLG